MITITEYDSYVLISSPEKSTYLKKGMGVLDFIGGKMTVSERVAGTFLKTPIFSVNRLGQLGAITDKSGEEVTSSSLQELSGKIAQFFV
jgi:hypothetical protein